MKSKKKLVYGVIFLIAILTYSAVLVSAIASFSSSNPQSLSPGASSFSYLQRQGVNAFPIFDPSRCEAGQDFILQIAPFGCEPSVVRSDLLEEQNVPVFCQIAATKINPLIDVNVIDSITFSNQNSSREVAGVGFHPARAAINPSRGTLINSPLLENIGYVVILLRQSPNESSMPDFVEGNLAANIRYDIENAFGVGQAVYYLPIFEQQEWEGKFNQYGFWNGKGFLRAESIDNNGATVSVYSDKENLYSSFTLANGETSGEVYLPGFYCQTGLRLRLDGVENPDTYAKIDVNGEIFQVKERETFLNNKCSVLDVDKKGLHQEVDVRCNTDNGPQTLTFSIAPEVKIEIGTSVANKKLGDLLYEGDGKFVYLAYIGTKENTNKEEDLFVFLVSSQNRNLNDKLTDAELTTASNIVSSLQSEKFTGVPFLNFFVNGVKAYPGIIQKIIDFFGEGKSYEIITFEKPREFEGKQLILRGLSTGSNVDIEKKYPEIFANYENSLKDYREIIDNYDNETETTIPKTVFGEKALANAIEMANLLEQKEKKVELCSEFNEKYSGSELKPSSCKDSLSDSKSISINGRTKTITFAGIYEPSYDDLGAEVEIKYPSGEVKTVELKNRRGRDGKFN